MKSTHLKSSTEPPELPSNRLLDLISALSNTAVFAGLYVTGAAAFCAQVSGLAHLLSAKSIGLSIGVVFSTTVAVYLLDRVKLRDSWLDPADAHAHPRRHAFVQNHTRALRFACSCLLIAAGWLGSQMMPFGWVLPLIAAAGVLIYAGQPRAARPRPKDILLVKNAYAAIGIAAFAALVTAASVTPGSSLAVVEHTVTAHAGPLFLAFLHLAVRVLADAILCDIDDEQADRRFRTQTLAVHFGRVRSWNIALTIRVASAAVLAATPLLPLWPRLLWAIVTVCSSLLLRVAAPPRLRDWVDCRLAIEALVVGCGLFWLRNR